MDVFQVLQVLRRKHLDDGASIFSLESLAARVLQRGRTRSPCVCKWAARRTNIFFDQSRVMSPRDGALGDLAASLVAYAGKKAKSAQKQKKDDDGTKKHLSSLQSAIKAIQSKRKGRLFFPRSFQQRTEDELWCMIIPQFRSTLFKSMNAMTEMFDPLEGAKTPEDVLDFVTLKLKVCETYKDMSIDVDDSSSPFLLEVVRSYRDAYKEIFGDIFVPVTAGPLSDGSLLKLTPVTLDNKERLFDRLRNAMLRMTSTLKMIEARDTRDVTTAERLSESRADFVKDMNCFVRFVGQIVDLFNTTLWSLADHFAKTCRSSSSRPADALIVDATWKKIMKDAHWLDVRLSGVPMDVLDEEAVCSIIPRLHENKISPPTLVKRNPRDGTAILRFSTEDELKVALGVPHASLSVIGGEYKICITARNDSTARQLFLGELDQAAARAYVEAEKKKVSSRLCAFCNKVASLKCERCRSVYYCSSECQANDWKAHERVCKRPT